MEKYFNPLESTRSFLLSWTKTILRKHGVKPRRRFSQNFVVDPLLLREVTGYLESEDYVLEVGCGLGTLSMALLSKTRRLLCIELDPRLCSIARDVVGKSEFIVVNGDALKTPFTSRTLVSNLPYHITSELLVKTARENTVEKVVLTIQREVAERLTAPPGSKQYGRITILVSLLFNVKLGGVYPPSSFYPKPEVSHQVIVLTRKRRYTDEVRVVEDVTRVFSLRGKDFSRKYYARSLVWKPGI